jgi:hypothetical protein
MAIPMAVAVAAARPERMPKRRALEPGRSPGEQSVELQPGRGWVGLRVRYAELDPARGDGVADGEELAHPLRAHAL